MRLWPRSTMTQGPSRQEPRDLLDRLLRRRKPDALQLAPADMIEALERQREVRAAARLQHGVDLVDDHDARGLQHLARALGGQQQVQRLGRRHEDVRRRAQHRRALVLRRVAAAHRRGDLDRGVAHRLGERVDFAARLGQVLVDVRRQRLQRRDVDDPHLVGQSRQLGRLAEQLVDRGQERGERLAGAGRRRDQRVLAAPDGAPAFGSGRRSARRSGCPTSAAGRDGNLGATTRLLDRSAFELSSLSPDGPGCVTRASCGRSRG